MSEFDIKDALSVKINNLVLKKPEKKSKKKPMNL